MVTIAEAKDNYKRKKERMIKNYKKIVKPGKESKYEDGLKTFVGGPVNPNLVEAYKEALEFMPAHYEAVMKTPVEEKWEARVREKFSAAS